MTINDPKRMVAAALLFLLIPQSCKEESADLRIVSVDKLGKMDKPDSIVGRDGGISGLFQGRSVWVYGDSVAALEGTYPTTWRNNTMSWTSDLDASDGITGFVQPEDELGAAREFFPRTDEEEAFNEAHVDLSDGTCESPCGARYAIWGSGPAADPARNRALLTYGKVYAEPGEFNFTILGTSIAIWEDFETGPVRPTVSSSLDDPTLLFDASEGEFAIPAVDDVYLYLFSCSGGKDDSTTCRLARSTLDDILNRDAWRFRAEDGWSQNIDDAIGLFSGSPNMTVHWNGYLNRWLAVYIDWGKIVVRTAPSIDGPWSGRSTVFEPKEESAIHALAHAEYQEDGGAVEYISYLADNEFRLLRVQVEPID